MLSLLPYSTCVGTDEKITVVGCKLLSFTANEGDTTAKTTVKEIFLPGSYEWVIVHIKIKIITHSQIFC